jgi:hypothetical protein
MRKIITALVLILVSNAIFAQTPNPSDELKKKVFKKPKRQDQIILDLHGSQLLKNNSYGVKQKAFSHGISAALMWDAPIKKSPIALGAGLGVSNENYFLDKMVSRTPDNGTEFIDFPLKSKSYKFSTTTIEIPLELRIRFKPERRNSIKMAFGFKIGYVVQSKTKYKGEAISYGTLIQDAKIKEYDIPGINRLRYGVHFRMGYGRFAGTFSYALSEMFQPNKGPQGWAPVSLGFTLTPF